MANKKKIPTILVKQRVLLKKTNFKCEFFDGYARLTYEDPVVAEESYKAMKNNNLPVVLEGKDVLYDYYDGKSAKYIYKKYLGDIQRAMTKNNFRINITYKEVEE